MHFVIQCGTKNWYICLKKGFQNHSFIFCEEEKVTSNCIIFNFCSLLNNCYDGE